MVSIDTLSKPKGQGTGKKGKRVITTKQLCPEEKRDKERLGLCISQKTSVM